MIRVMQVVTHNITPGVDVDDFERVELIIEGGLVIIRGINDESVRMTHAEARCLRQALNVMFGESQG